MSRLDRAVELARRDRPAGLPPGEAERLVARALAGARRPERPRRYFAGLAYAALVASLALAVPVARPTSTPPAELVLASGDRVLTAADSKVEIVALAPGERRLALASGSALFAVAPGKGRFVVDSGDTRVEVRGTVFTVSRDARGTEVRVYEGKVEVFHAGQVHALAAGASWGSTGPIADQDPLAAPARAEASARAPTIVPLAEPPVPAGPSLPVPPPLPLDAGPSRPSAEPAEPDDDELHFWVRSGRAEDALAGARRAFRRTGSPAYRVIEADALRALGRLREAAETYLDAADGLDETSAARVGYLAARVYLDELDAPLAALAALDRSGADDSGSPLEERALALRVRALVRSKQDPCPAAATYRVRFPAGPEPLPGDCR